MSFQNQGRILDCWEPGVLLPMAFWGFVHVVMSNGAQSLSILFTDMKTTVTLSS